jgi:hypothetical protein
MKAIDVLISLLSNIIVHKVLSSAVQEEILRDHYAKEMKASYDAALKYRSMINPRSTALSERDIGYIREKIIRKARNELNLRIAKGYANLHLDDLEKVVDDVLKEYKIT